MPLLPKTMSTTTIAAPDLTQRPPRSPRVRLGGYALLPRSLDKGRAEIAGKNGPYHYACPVDQQFLDFVGISAEALREQLALGKGDGEILEWINENATHKRQPWEIAAWSTFQETRAAGDVDSKEWFLGEVKNISTTRTDIISIADYLDADDHISYGGKA